MIRQTGKVILLEVLAGAVLILLGAVGVFAWRVSAGPVSLPFFVEDAEHAISDLRDGRPVSLRGLSLEWLSDERRLVVTGAGLRLYDATAIEVAAAERVEIALDGRALLGGRIRPVGLRLSQGWIGVTASDRGWSVAGEPIGLSGGDGPALAPLSFDAFLHQSNIVLSEILDVLRNTASRLEVDIALRQVDVVARDASGREVARLTETEGALARIDEGLRLAVSGTVDAEGGAWPRTVSVDVVAPRDFGRLDARFSGLDWSLEAAAAQLGYEDVTGLPGDLLFTAALAAETGLERIGIAIDAGPGAATLGAREVEFEGISVSASYDAEGDALTLDAAAFDAGYFNGPFRITVGDILGGEGPRPFELESEGGALDLRPIFARPVDLGRVSSDGFVDVDKRVLSIAGLSVGYQRTVLRASGDVAYLGAGEPGQLPFRLDMAAEFIGPMTETELLALWPAGLARGARTWVQRNVTQATLRDISSKLLFEPDSLVKGYLADEAVALTFSLADGVASYLHDAPPLTGAVATGRLTGNSFRIDVTEGAIGPARLREGSVAFPKFNPSPGAMLIEARADGRANALLRVVSDTRLQLEATTGFDPDRVSGDASVAFEFSRPTGPPGTPKPVTYRVIGEVKNGGFADIIGDIGLEGADARFVVDQNGLTVQGDGRFASAPLQFEWVDQFNDQGAPSTVIATGFLTPDALNAFGVTGRAYFSGEAPVEIQAQIGTPGVLAASVTSDLSEARLDVAEIDWAKPAGAAASIDIDYALTIDGPSTTVRFDAPGGVIDGEAVLGEGGRLDQVRVRRAYLEDRFDISGRIRRLADGGLALELTGPFLDMSRAVSQFGPGTGGGGLTFDSGLTFDAEVGRLRLGDELDMTEARLALALTNDGLQFFAAEGLSQGEVQFSSTYDVADDQGPTITVESGDAGFLAEAFFGLDFIEGGDLELTGRLASGDLPTRILVRISDAQLTEAPLFTQILSLASLRGLADTLNGDGVLFTDIEIPLVIAGDRYVIEGGRASGPALGLTANGWIGQGENRGIDLQGVLVPSFGANSALGGIPIIGNLFVSRQGEGVFSLSYAIRGDLERAQVSVNPFSAITPGVLRRIFEDPANAPNLASAPDPGPVTRDE